MLERLAAYFLNTYVAEYVGNVVTDQLSIGWLGDVELEKLPLKKNALRKHQLPIDIVAGYIDKLKLQIPVRHIKSQPWVVQIDQLYVILGPSQLDKYDVVEEERRAQEKKNSRLDKMEQQWKEEQKMAGRGGWWFLSPFSLSFPSSILANLQIIINDIHIRYEDTSLGNSPFALGVLISSFSVQSTNENWSPEFMSDSERQYKLMDVTDFSLYWDTEMVGQEEEEDLVLAMQLKKAAMATQQDLMSASMMAGHAPSVDVIIKPTGGQVKMTRNCSKTPLRSTEGPRFKLDVKLDEIPVVVTAMQYCSIVRGGEEMGRRWRGRRWRRWRPLKPVTDNRRGWWMFVIRSVLERVRERNKRCSLSFALRRARQNVAYVAWYTQHLTQISVPEESRRVKEEVEREQSYEEIVVLRRLVMTRVKTERDLAEAAKQRIESESGSQQQPGIMHRWFSSWISGYQGQQQQQTQELEEEEKKLLEELGYEADTASSLHSDSIFLQLTFTLQEGSLSLLTSPSPSLSDLGPECLASLSFSSLQCSLEMRPRVHGATFELSLGGLMLEDGMDHQTVFPVLVKHKGEELPIGHDQQFQLSSDQLPPCQSGMETALFGLRALLERGRRIHFHVHSKPLDMVYSRDTTTQLIHFIRNPWSRERGVANKQLGAELHSHTTAEIRHRIEELLGDNKASQYQVSVRLNISAPRIIIPEDVWNRDTRMVIVDLGHVTFGSVSDWSEEQEKALEQGLLLTPTAAMETEEDEDEEFATPLSSPVSELETTDGDSAPSLTQPVDSTELSSAIRNAASRAGTGLERYLLKMSDLQVLVRSSQQHSQQHHMLEKFTLSTRLQRCLDSSVSSGHAHFSVWASLPSLCFHVDEEKIHTLISCLRPPVPPPSSPSSPITSHTSPSLPTQSVYMSAYSPESFDQSESTVQESIYHSSYGGLPHDNRTRGSMFGALSDTRQRGRSFAKQLSCDRKVARERYQRRLLLATEELLSAQFSIDEVLLTLSSNGRVLTELNVPGVQLQLLRRPFDTRLDLTVQDICVVDRFQNFGPEFELVVCSDGRHLIRSFSPKNPSSEPTPSSVTTGDGGGKSFSCPSFGKNDDSSINNTTPMKAHRSDIRNVLFSPESDLAGLLSLSYQHVSPHSPEHPATRDLDIGEENGDGFLLPGDNEPEIHKVSLHCTAVDVMANQETVVELISFFKRAIPSHLLAGGDRGGGGEKREGGGEGGREGESDTVLEGGGGMVAPLQCVSLVQTEVGVVFERLGVRMLRRIRPLRKRRGLHVNPAQFIASIMFYRLSLDVQKCKETSLEGSLQGIEIEDLTPTGKKYKDLLTMGCQEGRGRGREGRGEEDGDTGGTVGKNQSLTFTVHISPQASWGCPSNANDVHITVSVPAIHYTHSVNLVHELEMFVSEFQQLSRSVMELFSSAAVGVAKGLVNEKSQFAEQLSTSLGPRLMNLSTTQPPGGQEFETVDAPLVTASSRDHLYLNICIQSPVIILPSSIQSDKCLVAYLGEISIKNIFVSDSLTNSTSVIAADMSPKREVLAIKIMNMSLHATHDVRSRELLVSNGGSDAQLYGVGRWWKVLRETSMEIQIERRLEGGREGGCRQLDRDAELSRAEEIGVGGIHAADSGGDRVDKSGAPTITVSDAENDGGSGANADVVVTGQIHDHLLLCLPKEVFDQIRVTLKHGLHRTATRKSHQYEANTTSSNYLSESLQTIPKSEELLKTASQRKALPSIAASFSLPRLSLELRHIIGLDERNFVYVSFEEFTAHVRKSDPHVTSVDIALRSIIIEDLLQEKESVYRYLLASSTKPLPLISPARSGVSPSSSLPGLPLSPSHLSPLTRPLFTLSHLMSSTPRAPLAPSAPTDSPLRSFSPQLSSTGTSQTSSKPVSTSDHHHHHDISVAQDPSDITFATPKTSFKQQPYTSRFSGLVTHRIGTMSPETGLTSQKTRLKEGNETGSTLQEDVGCHGDSRHSNLSDVTGLLSVKAKFVEEECPEFASKYNSVSGHVDVEFSSASVIINLQTWVLLLDYLGIGIPTPPPSPSSSLLDNEDEEDNTQQQSESSVRSTKSVPGSLFETHFEETSINHDTLDSISLPSPNEHQFNNTTANEGAPQYLRPTTLSATNSLQSSLYSSAWTNPLELPSEWQTPSPQGNQILDPTLSENQTPSQGNQNLDLLRPRDSTDCDSVWGTESKKSMDISLNVQSLTVTFNKPEHPLARGVVSSLAAQVESRRGNLQLRGSLGQASVVDLTETGAYYRERFTTTGEQALMFEIFKYGRPDPHMERPHDISVCLVMASVRYLHTMRFLKEVLAFCSHFPQLIDAFQRMKALAQGNLVDPGPGRKPRISLDVDLDGPVLLIPKHAFSPEIMAGDIGHVKVTNTTRYDGEEGTLTHMNLTSGMSSEPIIPVTPLSEQDDLFPQATPTLSHSDPHHPPSHPHLSVSEMDKQMVESRLKAHRGPCLVDCIKLGLSDVDMFSARKVNLDGDNFKIVRQRGAVLKEKGSLTLYIERNLSEDYCRDVPDLHIEGTLSAVYVILDKTQLELIKGLLDMNLGEGIEEFEKPSTVINDPIGPPMAAEVWTGFLFRMRFLGVQLEFLQQRQSEVPGSLEVSLALFDIQDSEFSFQSRSNQTRTVNFINHSVIGYDTRYSGFDPSAKPSVFSEVLRPRFKTTDYRPIQVQIHVTLSPTHIGATILLNKLRLIGLFDLLMMLKSFVFDKLPDRDMQQEADEVDLYIEPPPLRQLPTSPGLKTTPPEKKPAREVRVRLSITETDIVVVEDLTSPASSAVVMKGTLLLKFQSLPKSHKWLYTSIDALELFSCNLDNEEESALSILDPVTITMEIKPPSGGISPGGISRGADSVGGLERVREGTMQAFEVEFRQLNVRLSYNDLKLFLAIAQSLPALSSHSPPPTPTPIAENTVDEALVRQLLPLGFSRSEICHQLSISSNNVNDAANRLLDMRRKQGEREGEGEGEDGVIDAYQEETDKKFSIGKFELVIESLSVCLIDDSANRDVPLLDLCLSQVQAAHDPWRRRGEATAVMSGDYYNRHISAWEPVLEPWRLKLIWEKVASYSTDLDSKETSDRVYCKLTSPQRLCVNVTSSLIQILQVTQSSWRQDISRITGTEGGRAETTPLNDVMTRSHRRTGSGRSHDLSHDLSGGGQEVGSAVSHVETGLTLLHSVRFVSETRQRSKFIPFLLRNSTGLRLQFATLTSVPSKVYVSPMSQYQDSSYRQEVGVASDWTLVESGKEKPFEFSHHSKQRHLDTRAVVVHQLLVKVDRWKRINIPVSVDKIGIFFREVKPSLYSRSASPSPLPPCHSHTWLVFAISLSDTQKIVNVRSSLVLHNTTELTLDVRLEPSDSLPTAPTNSRGTVYNRPSSVTLPPLAAKGYAAIPLHKTHWDIRVRPHGWGTQYCGKNLVWRHASGRSPTSHVRTCEWIGEREDQTPFRFCVSVQRDNFPIEPSSSPPLPAHTLTILPPLTIANLLACDVQIFINHHSTKMIRRGKEIAVYFVNTEKPIELNATLEGFNMCQGCKLSLNAVGRVRDMIVQDSRGRPLRLTVTSEVMGGSALKISISCAYWLVNHTGLPLVFRQDGVKEEAAGQWEEHERASTSSPLLYAYQEGDTIEKCVMRLGRRYHEMSGAPKWCSPFRMISDSGAVRLFSQSRDGRPDQEFQIGVEIRRGQGQYQNTRIVTFVARYQLENRTQYRLAYLQRHQLHDEAYLGVNLPILMPRAIASFHWPRTDLDQLIIIRVEDISSCQWSGGFTLNKDHSFHIHMRGTTGHSIFVRCNMTLNGATHHVLFSDAALYPTPFRLENLSQIGVSYYQLGTTIPPPSLLNPGQSVPYAWDETTQPEKLCLQVQGSREVKEFDLETFEERGKLYYERYFYIAASATFPGRRCGLLPGTQEGPPSELVLDVPQGTAVIFQKRDPSRRSQLWRMTPLRQLVHIASSSGQRDMVLGIAGKLPPRGQFVTLMIERKSESKEDRQTWRFTEDGWLLLDTAQHLCVQSPLDYLSLREGADVVLGHIMRTNDGGIPPEQQLCRYRHSPGSGVLTVEVMSDGPTRILRITDHDKKYSHMSLQDDWTVSDYGQVAPSKSSNVDLRADIREDEGEEGEEIGGLEIDVSLALDHGLGVSLINSVPEELVFGSVDGLQVQFNSSHDQQCVNITVQNMQVDNQLPNSHSPLLLYRTPPASSSEETVDTYPVIHVFAERIPHKSPFATVFKVVKVEARELTILLEERLLFKLLQWAGLGGGKGTWSGTSDSSEDELMNMFTHRSAVLSSADSISRQIYFETFTISETELKVSMHTTSQLPEDLQQIKKHMGLPLVKFESPIFLDGFYKAHLLDSPSGVVNTLIKHYKKAIRSQALKILGSVDFLGNPVGLVSDVASGVAGVLDSQDVVGLVRDVTHGMSDTTSKLTGTVSHMLGQATFDSSFQEEREQMQEQCQTSGDHLKAGIIGLSSGVFGGMTSIFTQPYRGAVESGVGGFITGVGKGLLGTVAKPVAGLFDLASGTSAALRETTSRVSRFQPPPVRHRRCCIGSSGTLTCFSEVQAKGQEYLLRLNDGAQNEKLVSYEILRDMYSDPMRLIISSQYLYLFKESPPDPESLEYKIPLSTLEECRVSTGKSTIPTAYLVVSLLDTHHREGHGEKRYLPTKFKCTDEKKARKVAQLINYAKNLHEEEKRVIRMLRLQQDTIW